MNNKKVRHAFFKGLKITFLLAVIFSMVGWAVETPSKTGWGYYREAREAYQKQDYKTYLELLQKAVALLPDYNPFKYDLAVGYALNGNKKEALNLLKTVAQMGMDFPVAQNKDLDTLKDTSEFKGLIEKFAENAASTAKGKVALVIPENDLIPEGITYNPKTGTFYVTAIYKRKIVSISNTGKVKDFIGEKQDGFWSGVGLKVDVKRQVLWVNTASGDQMKDYKDEKTGKAAVFKYDLTTGKLVKKYGLEDEKNHLFNDMVLNENGDVFITDSESSELYFISRQRDQLEIFQTNKPVMYPNGITISPEGKTLYVAHIEGIARVNTTDGKVQKLFLPEGVAVTGIDGLYYYRGSLIAIQNYGGLNRVARFYLNGDLNTVKKMTVLEANHTLFNIPTTGVPVGHDFYYIANSQLASFNEDHTIFPPEKLKEVVILKVALRE